MERHAILARCVLLLAASVPTLASKEDADHEVKRLAVPSKLMPPDKSLLFLLRAEGAQVYRAEKKGDGLVWAFREPDAILLDYETGQKVGTHGKGPFWKDSDGGKVLGISPQSAPSPRAGAIPWLLLKTNGKPTGRFEKVTHIQRIDTWAGQPPKIDSPPPFSAATPATCPSPTSPTPSAGFGCRRRRSS